MSKLTKTLATLVLALYVLASMHCALEGVPGLDFLKTCCFVDSSTPASHDCESDSCAVENAKYRSEEQRAFAPQPVLVLALVARIIETPLPESQPCTFGTRLSPPDLPKAWQFSYRTALPPRAPSPLA